MVILDATIVLVALPSIQRTPASPSRACSGCRAPNALTFGGLLADPAALATACADGSVAVVGDLSAIGRLLHAITDPVTLRRSDEYLSRSAIQ